MSIKVNSLDYIVGKTPTKIDYSEMSIIEHVKLYVDDGMDEKEAIKLVAKERQIAKSIVYKEYHLGKWLDEIDSRIG